MASSKIPGIAVYKIGAGYYSWVMKEDPGLGILFLLI